MSLELVDMSIQCTRGIVENVLIKVGKFLLPIDFVNLDMPEGSRVSIILGRPFLATAQAMIDVFNKKITLRVRDDEVIFDMDQSIKRSPAEDYECYRVDDLNDAINAETQELLANDTIDSFLLKGLEKSIEQSDLKSCKCEAIHDSDSIRPIESINKPYPVAQEIEEPNKVKTEQLYSANTNKIDKKKLESIRIDVPVRLGLTIVNRIQFHLNQITGVPGPESPPPSPLSPHPFSTYQKIIAEADLTKRERALITVPPYETEVGKGFMCVAVTSRGETALTVCMTHLRDVKPQVEIDQWETLLEDPIDELITRFRKVCEDAEIRARDTQEEAQEKRLEALENVIQQICRNNY
nr:hypothetical protein [Tanacetum cinerariifolium]